MGKIVLVTGGARSGKSSFAENYAAASGKSVAYIATAQIYDNEMKHRVKLHRDRRPSSWLTWETPYAADEAIGDAAAQAGIILFDCLTLYTSNLMLAPKAPQQVELRFSYVMEQVDKLIKVAQAVPATVIIVTNEVGLGIVPDNAMAREYRDLAGIANQRVAAVADEVYLTISGLAVELKKIAVAVEVAHHG